MLWCTIWHRRPLPSEFRFSTTNKRPITKLVTSSRILLLVDGIVGLQQLGLVKQGDPMAIALTAWSTMHGLVTLALDGRAPFGGESKTGVTDQLENHVTVATEILMFGMAGKGENQKGKPSRRPKASARAGLSA